MVYLLFRSFQAKPYDLLRPLGKKRHNSLYEADIPGPGKDPCSIETDHVLPSSVLLKHNETDYASSIPISFKYLKVFGAIEYNQLKICAGYLVANLKKQREDGISSAFVDYLSEHSERLVQLEQDVINFCCKERQIEYLPLSYVVCSYMYDVCKTDAACCSDPFYTYREMKDAMEHPIQLHYATKTKPWNTPDSTKAEIWFEYLKKTEFYEDYLNI